MKLCDFGWSVNLLRSEKRTTFCGTFEYMVPEIVCEEKYDTGVDIWALGILLYEMVILLLVLINMVKMNIKFF